MPKILVADNQPEWRTFSQRVLGGRGYDVKATDNLERLRRLLQENGFDIVLLNAELMREPFLDDLRAIVAQNPDDTFVVVSIPSSAPQTVQETRTAFKLGAKDCVDKPFSAERLLSLVQELLAEFGGWRTQRQGVRL